MRWSAFGTGRIATTAMRACAIVVALVAAGDALAAGAVAFQTWNGGASDAQLAPGQEATATGGGQAASMAGNPLLDGSAWAHTGNWWSFHVADTSAVRVRVVADDAAELAPGLAVWAMGPTAAFDGGTTGFGGETSTAGFGTPHSFNAYGQLGDAGTLWMQEGQGGNARELMAFAVSGPSLADPGGWGESIANGAHDQRAGDEHVAAVSGLVGPGFAELLLEGVPAGWFAVYVGGTDPSLSGGGFRLRISSVPEPGTAALVLLGVAGLTRVGRRRAAR